MRARTVLPVLVALSLAACGPRPSAEQRAQALAAFATVQQVFQHPRCQNCHIPGDAPLQFDAGVRHAMGVMRGAEGHGAPGLPCATCHGESNPPASYGPNAPPGAPHWGLPPPEHKMAWIGLSPSELCASIKSKKALRCSSTSARTSWCCGVGTRAAGARRCRYRTTSSSPSSGSGRQPAGRVRAISSPLRICPLESATPGDRAPSRRLRGR